jgi:tetratricopeptide (TPR) repeat protein
MTRETPRMIDRPGADTAALCALVIVAPQLFGGAFAWAVLAIAGLSLLALATALWVRRDTAHPVVDVVLVMMSIAWLWTCSQVLEWPEAVARALDLASLQRAETLAGLEWAPDIPLTISLDPGATLLQISIGVAILSTFIAARLGGPEGLKPVATATVVSALLLGLEGLLHSLFGAEAVFGVYAPRFTQPQLLTPLMNGNHLGGVALLGALLGVALAMERTKPSPRFWTVAAGLCALTVAATLSRGAIGSLVFGFVVLAVWISGRGRERRAGRVALAVLVATVVGVVTFTGLEPILRRFETQGFDKLGVAARGFRLLEGSTWWLGIGRGAFSSVFVAEEGSVARYTHPENLIVQWTTEWGVPLGLGLLLVLAAALWSRLRATDEPLVVATCIGLAALGLQNLVDFSLEMAGVVVVAAALLGAVLPIRSSGEVRRVARFSWGVLVGFAAVLVLLGPRVVAWDVQAVVDRLTWSMEYDREVEFRAALDRGLTLHPNEPALALLAGAYAGSRGHPDAPRWLSLAMEDAPGWASPHVIAAQWLLESGRLDQALVEAREAEERHPGSANGVVCEILGRLPSMEHLDRVTPSAELRPGLLDRASACASLPQSLRTEIDQAILQIDPTRVSAVRRQARRLGSQERHEEALALLGPAVAEHPADAGLWSALVRAHLDSGDADSAGRALSTARQGGLDNRALTEAQARVETALGQADAMRRTIAGLKGQARGDASLVAAAFMLQAELEASLGNVDEALAAYGSADLAKPETPALLRAAELAVRSGRRAQGRRLYARLCDRAPGGPECTRAAKLARDLAERPERVPLP